MPGYRLSRDVTVQFRGFYTVTAKAGTPLQMIRDGMGKPCYAIPPHACDPGALAAMFKHDATYFYVWAPADAVETVEG